MFGKSSFKNNDKHCCLNRLSVDIVKIVLNFNLLDKRNFYQPQFFFYCSYFIYINRFFNIYPIFATKVINCRTTWFK